MLRRVLLSVVLVGMAAALALLAKAAWRGNAEPRQAVLSNGRLFRVEAVTFGTNHVVGWNDWWLVPLRGILPSSVVHFLSPTRGQSRQTTDSPALVVWVYARDPKTGKYVDCQGVRASFIDDQGDVYPANSTAHGAFADGFNREAYTFKVFPRRAARLKLQLTPWRSSGTKTLVLVNPLAQTPAIGWTPETLPASHRIGDLELRLESLTIHTNGGKGQEWEPLSLHWQPEFSLSRGGQPATNWESPEWEAEDVTGNRGQTLGLREPMQKFVATTYPTPDGVSDEAKWWRLPAVALPVTARGFQWNTNRALSGAAVTVIGLFPPGAYTFSQGQLTALSGGALRSAMRGWTGLSKQVLPGKWQYWATFGTTNDTAFLRWKGGKPEQRIAVGLRYRQGQVSKTQWGRCDEGGGVSAFVFDDPIEGVEDAGLEVVLLEPLHAEFVVRPPFEKLDKP